MCMVDNEMYRITKEGWNENFEHIVEHTLKVEEAVPEMNADDHEYKDEDERRDPLEDAGLDLDKYDFG